MQNQITEGSILKPLLSFFFPILLGTFFQQLYNTVDAIIVGNFVGTAALGAVGGPTAVIINFLVNLFVGLSSGATVVVAQYYGARQGTELREAVHTGVALALAAGVVVTAIGLLISAPALRLMGTPEDVMGYAITYLRVYFCGSIASFLYNMGASILRAIGDTRRPLYFLMAACLTNIVLDLFFVVALDLAVLGVGLATVMSQVVSAVLVAVLLVVLALAGGLGDGSLAEYLLATLACGGIALLLNGVTLPLLLKFGAEKARMVSMALFLVVFGGTALAGLAVDSGFAFPAPPAWVVAAIPGLLAILSVGGFVLSYFIAQAVYAKKEF